MPDAEVVRPQVLATLPSRAPSPATLATVRGFPTPWGPLDLDVHAGDVVHLCGGNGAGKTSLLRALAGLPAPLRPARVEVLGRDPRAQGGGWLADRVHFGPQDPGDGLVGLTVAGEFRLRRRPLHASVAHLADQDVPTLSSGEAARVAGAVAAASGAPLVLLDEPAAALDAGAQGALDALVAQAIARGGAVVVADHTGWAAGVATRAVRLGAAADAGEPLRPIPVPDGATILAATAAEVRRGRRVVRLPEVRLGPGLHAVTGPNGSGKSTLLARLAGLRDSAGVWVDGAPPRAGVDVRLLQAGGARRTVAATVEAELAGVPVDEPLRQGLPLDRHPFGLSAGEAQRAALAKALGVPARVHLLDEPEAHLDAGGRSLLRDAIARRVAGGACVVVATHDPGLAALAATRIALGAPT